jgi:hypothetical protein
MESKSGLGRLAMKVVYKSDQSWECSGLPYVFVRIIEQTDGRRYSGEHIGWGKVGWLWL